MARMRKASCSFRSLEPLPPGLLDPYSFVDDLPDTFKNLVFSHTSINHLHSTGFLSGNGEIPLPYTVMELNLLPFEPTFFLLVQDLISLQRPLQSRVRGTIQEERDVWPNALGGNEVHLLDPFQTDSSTVALISDRGVAETVA